MTDITKSTMSSRIPEFKSYEEEAAFWDTHDVSDYWDDLAPTAVRFAKKPTNPISVRFEEDDLNALRTIAGKKGLGPTILIRMWTLEKLHEEKASHKKRY